MEERLSPIELQAITGERILRRQVAKLVAMGVPFRFGGGEVAVSRSVATELPQWAAVEAKQAPRLDLVR